MRAIDIAREYYELYGRPMLERDFAELCGRVAVGLCGEGSECLRYDDELSRDHDLDVGFCMFLTAEDEERYGFKLQRAYDALPQEFHGLKKGRFNPVGGRRRGVISIDEFYTRFLGSRSSPRCAEEWLRLPSYALLCASNGEVFSDPLGEFSAIRDVLLAGYPEDVRRKKLAAHAVMMAQSGQYNYPRLLKRGELGGAQFAVYEFVRHAISSIYLLNRRYEPFYKWAYRGLRELPRLSEFESSLIALTELDNSKENAELKLGMIDDIAALFAREYRSQGVSCSDSSELETQAITIQNTITDANVRNLHIMDGI